MKLEDVLKLMKDVPDFPKAGIIFKDITPILENAKAFRALTQHLCDSVAGWKPQKLLAIESRGFILASAMAPQLECGLALVRKSGKLPRKTVKTTYSLEYGQDSVEMHSDTLLADERVVIIDDVLATGGTIRAALQLCSQVNAKVCGAQVLLELGFLKGREQLKPIEIRSLLTI